MNWIEDIIDSSHSRAKVLQRSFFWKRRIGDLYHMYYHIRPSRRWNWTDY